VATWLELSSLMTPHKLLGMAWCVDLVGTIQSHDTPRTTWHGVVWRPAWNYALPWSPWNLLGKSWCIDPKLCDQIAAAEEAEGQSRQGPAFCHIAQLERAKLPIVHLHVAPTPKALTMRPFHNLLAIHQCPQGKQPAANIQ
jgi:hypothetical protein